MITAEKINIAKLELNLPRPHLENDNNIRIAFEWLDAQMIAKIHIGKKFDLRSLMCSWGGIEISQNEIEIAAHMHSKINGDYPLYNINPRLTYPSTERLRNNIESNMQNFEEMHIMVNYRYFENVKYTSNDGREVFRSFQREELPVAQFNGLDFCEKNDCECYYCVYGR